jgi:hypothetical protein
MGGLALPLLEYNRPIAWDLLHVSHFPDFLKNHVNKRCFSELVSLAVWTIVIGG